VKFSVDTAEQQLIIVKVILQYLLSTI
jgi:hypothetical protein